MYTVSFLTDLKKAKPFFDMYINGVRITCLYDTGASTAQYGVEVNHYLKRHFQRGFYKVQSSV